MIGNIPVYTHDEEGLQGVGVDPSFATNRLHLPLLRAAAVHPGRRRAGRPAPPPTSRRWTGRQPAVPVHPERRLHAQPGQRGDHPRRARRPGHLLPRRRRHRLRRGRQPLPVHRRRHQPVRLRRLLADRRADQPQPGLRRAAHRRQHQRPARQDPADQGRTPTARYTIPAGNLFAPGTAQHPARDLRDGLPQPVPDERRQGHRRRLPRRLRPRRRRRRRQPRARRARSSSTGSPRRATTAGRTAPAPTPPPSLQRVELRHRTVRAPSSTAPAADEQLVPQHRPDHAAAGPGRPGSATAATPAPAGVRRRLRVADGRPGLPLRRRARPRRSSSRSRSTARSSPASSAARWIKPIDVNADGTARRDRRRSRGPARRSWTWRSARTARCTCSTTAPASSTATRTRRSTASSTSAAATGRRSPWPAPTATSGAGAADRDVLLGRRADPEGGALTYAWDFGDGTTSTAANPTHTYTTNGTYTATLTVRDPQRRAPARASVDDQRRQHRADGHAQRARRTAQLFSFGDTRAVHDHGHRPRGRHDRLRQGEDDLRPRPRQPRPPDHLADRLHRHDHRSRSTVSTTTRRTSSASSTPSTPTTAGLTTHTPAHPAAAAPAGRALQDARPASTPYDQDHRRGRQDRRRHRQRRLDRVRPVQADNATSFTARVSSGGVGRHAAGPGRLADRHRARLGDRPGDRRLGDLHRRHRARHRRAGRHHHAVPGLRRRHRLRCSTWTLHLRPPAAAPASARSWGWRASAWTCAAAAPPTARRSSSTPATAPRRRPGRVDRSARCGRSASAWTSPAAAPPTAPRSSCGPATAAAAQNWAAQRRRHAAQPAVGQVPGRVGRQLRRRHAVVHLWTCHGGANQKWTLP